VCVVVAFDTFDGVGGGACVVDVGGGACVVDVGGGACVVDVGGGACVVVEGGGECVGLVVGTTTFNVTALVVQVAPVQSGVPSFVNTATFVITCAVVSVALTTTWKLTATELATPGATVMPVQVTIPAFSVTAHPGAPAQVAEPVTYVVPVGTLSVTVTGVVAAVPESVKVNVYVTFVSRGTIDPDGGVELFTTLRTTTGFVTVEEQCADAHGPVVIVAVLTIVLVSVALTFASKTIFAESPLAR
jgi:hypothetical protein